MDAKLTYLFFLSFAACLVSSCASDAPESMDSGKGAELSFAVSGLSRASVTTSINKFAVYGDTKLPADATAEPVVIFNNTEVEYRKDSDSWYYNNTQYWYPNREHSFVAVSPVSVLEAGNNPRYSNSQLSFTYTIPTTDGSGTLSSNSDVNDIIVATYRKLYDKDSFISTVESRVTLKFGHILSLINIAPALDDNIMKNDEYILIRKLELSGVTTKARFDIVPAPRQSNNETDDMVVDVTGQEDGNLTIRFNEPVKIFNNRKNVSLFKNDDAIIMLPRVFAAGSDAKFIISYSINDDPEIKQISLSLDNRSWESGKSYAYKFTIDRIGLLHSEQTTIVNWDVTDAGNVDVY